MDVKTLTAWKQPLVDLVQDSHGGARHDLESTGRNAVSATVTRTVSTIELAQQR